MNLDVHLYVDQHGAWQARVEWGPLGDVKRVYMPLEALIGFLASLGAGSWQAPALLLAHDVSLR